MLCLVQQKDYDDNGKFGSRKNRSQYYADY